LAETLIRVEARTGLSVFRDMPRRAFSGGMSGRGDCYFASMPFRTLTGWRRRPRRRRARAGDPVAESGTVTWYAFRLSETTYGIFDTFEGEEGRQAHLNGQIPAALGQVGPDLLASDPDIRTLDVLAVK